MSECIMSSTNNKSKASLKQGSLFSFFSKKPKSPTSTASSTAAAVAKAATPSHGKASDHSDAATTKSPSSPSENKINSKEEDWKKVTLGSRISVYWPDDDEFYAAKVSKQSGKSSKFYLEYDDGECEWLDLSQERFRLLGKRNPDTEAHSSTTKRRRIETDDEEEAEFDVESSEEDDGSAYDPKSVPSVHDEEDEDNDQWMVTDDEGDKEILHEKKAVKKLKVTHHKGTQDKTTKSLTAPTDSTSALKTPLRQFANTVSPSIDSSHKSSISSATSPPSNPRRQISQSPTIPEKALPYTKGAVNPRGSHVHNHLEFLKNPRDSEGRKRGEPGYDPRTLKVIQADWDRHCGKMTDAVKQWWDLKSQYFDTVLLFKTGKPSWSCHGRHRS